MPPSIFPAFQPPPVAVFAFVVKLAIFIAIAAVHYWIMATVNALKAVAVCLRVALATMEGHLPPRSLNLDRPFLHLASPHRQSSMKIISHHLSKTTAATSQAIIAIHFVISFDIFFLLVLTHKPHCLSGIPRLYQRHGLAVAAFHGEQSFLAVIDFQARTAVTAMYRCERRGIVYIRYVRLMEWPVAARQYIKVSHFLQIPSYILPSMKTSHSSALMTKYSQSITLHLHSPCTDRAISNSACHSRTKYRQGATHLSCHHDDIPRKT